VKLCNHHSLCKNSSFKNIFLRTVKYFILEIDLVLDLREFSFWSTFVTRLKWTTFLFLHFPYDFAVPLDAISEGLHEMKIIFYAGLETRVQLMISKVFIWEFLWKFLKKLCLFYLLHARILLCITYINENLGIFFRFQLKYPRGKWWLMTDDWHSCFIQVRWLEEPIGKKTCSNFQNISTWPRQRVSITIWKIEYALFLIAHSYKNTGETPNARYIFGLWIQKTKVQNYAISYSRKECVAGWNGVWHIVVVTFLRK